MQYLINMFFSKIRMNPLLRKYQFSFLVAFLSSILLNNIIWNGHCHIILVSVLYFVNHTFTIKLHRRFNRFIFCDLQFQVLSCVGQGGLWSSSFSLSLISISYGMIEPQNRAYSKTSFNWSVLRGALQWSKYVLYPKRPYVWERELRYCGATTALLRTSSGARYPCMLWVMTHS